MADRVEIRTLSSRRLTVLQAYWQTMRGCRDLPWRRDIDPVDIPDLLPTLILLDVLTEDGLATPHFRFRLVGTRMVDVFGRDPTGQLLDPPLATPEGDTLFEMLCRVTESATPLARSGVVAWANGARATMEWLFLPLGSASHGVAMILAGADFFSPSLQYPTGEPRFERNAMLGSSSSRTPPPHAFVS